VVTYVSVAESSTVGTCIEGWFLLIGPVLEAGTVTVINAGIYVLVGEAGIVPVAKVDIYFSLAEEVTVLLTKDIPYIL